MSLISTEWLGSLPETWSLSPIKALVDERKELNTGYKSKNILSVMKDVGVINYKDKGNVGNKASEDFERYKLVFPGDIVANSMNFIIGSVGVSKEFGSLSPVYIVMRPKEAGTEKFLNYVFSSRSFQQNLTRIGYGILAHRMRIPWVNLKTQVVPNPPIGIQKRIVEFLDRETTKIDELIGKQERLLELLAEKRQAVITNAVTKGLDPSTPMKGSGIDWIGEIPAGWRISKLRFVSEVRVSNVDKHDVVGQAKVGLCNYTDVYKNDEITEELRFMRSSASSEQIRKFQLRDGDVLLTKDSESPSDIGIPSLVRGDHEGIICGYHLAMLRPYKKEVIGSFLYYSIMSNFLKAQFENSSKGVTRFGIGIYGLKSTQLLMPDLNSQQEISRYLEKKMKDIHALTCLIQTQIKLLKERRESLISHVVTGKVEV